MFIRVIALILLTAAITADVMVWLFRGPSDWTLTSLIGCSILFGFIGGNIITSIAYTKE